MMSEFKVIIIGGGLSGALLANGLLRNGVSTTVYEKDLEDHQREGYQIRLGEPSLIGFRACLDESRISQIEAKFGLSEGTVQDPARKSVGPYIYTSRFEPVIDLNALPNYSTSAAIDRVVLRNFLANPVKEQGCLRYGKAFDHYEIIPSDRADKVKVYFKDGSSDICDVLIGADGSSSQVLFPALGLIGDAMHAMQPNRGMGGNQAMQDSAEALPALLKLASASTNPTEANFVAALQGYENGMIDRAFDWVEQSGGCAIPYVDVDEVDGREQFLKAFVSKH